MPVADIDQTDIRNVLAPIWHDNADTAQKALNRLSIVMKHAAALGLDVDLQATEKAKALLGRQRHVVKHIPAQMMKGRVGATEDFRVPLSGEALDVIRLAKPLARDGFLFPSVRKGVISDATMSRFMERRGMEARPHGFRTSLRRWLAKATDAPHEVAETVLSHTVDGAVVRVYRRSDFLEQRRVLLDRWAAHVTGQSGNPMG